MDAIHIEGLRVDALVGVHAHEREGRQPLLFDLELAFDNRAPAASDDVADAVDYAAVCEAVRSHVGGREDQLLETLLESLAAALLEQFPAALHLRIRVHKPDAARALEDATFMLSGKLINPDGTTFTLEIDIMVVPSQNLASAYILQPDALADNVIVLYGCWELTSVLSFLMIGMMATGGPCKASATSRDERTVSSAPSLSATRPTLPPSPKRTPINMMPTRFGENGVAGTRGSRICVYRTPMFCSSRLLATTAAPRLWRISR